MSVLLHPILNVHLVAILVGLLSADGVVVLEFVTADFLHLLELLVVEQGRGGRHAKEKPRFAVELVVVMLLEEEAPEAAKYDHPEIKPTRIDNRDITATIKLVCKK